MNDPLMKITQMWSVISRFPHFILYFLKVVNKKRSNFSVLKSNCKLQFKEFRHNKKVKNGGLGRKNSSIIIS